MHCGQKKLAVYQKIYGCLIEIVKTVLDSVWELLLQRYHEENTLGEVAPLLEILYHCKLAAIVMGAISQSFSFILVKNVLN